LKSTKKHPQKIASTIGAVENAEHNLLKLINSCGLSIFQSVLSLFLSLPFRHAVMLARYHDRGIEKRNELE